MGDPWLPDASPHTCLHLHVVFSLVYVSVPKFYLKFIYLFIGGEGKWERGREMERERESQTGSALSAQNPIQSSNSWTVRSWPEPKSWVGPLTDWATQANPHPKSTLSIKDTSNTGLEAYPSPVWPHFNYICNNPISKWSYILRYWGLGLPPKNLGGHNSTHNICNWNDVL